MIMGLALASLVVTTGVLAFVGFATERHRREADQIVSQHTAELRLYQDARSAALSETTYTAGFFILQRPEAVTAVRQASDEMATALSELRSHAADHAPEDLAQIDEFETTHNRLIDGYERVFEAVQRGDTQAALSIGLSEGIEQSGDDFLADLKAAVDEARTDWLQALQDEQAAEATSNRVLFATIAIWTAVMAAGSFTLLRSVMRPIERMGWATRAIAAGDLTVRAPEAGPAEVARLGSDVNQMANVLIERSEQLARALAQEQERARQDSLTGTLNHAAVVDELRTRIAESRAGETVAIALADVDSLKAVNDTYGHPVGDAVLVTVANTLSTDGSVIGRYGGDEFLVILPGTDREAAERYRDAVLDVLPKTRIEGSDANVRVPVVASIGLAVYPDEAERIEDLIRLADTAMYTAKRQKSTATSRSSDLLVSGERAAKLVSDIVPLLTTPGSREDKLSQVAHHLSVGVGYDAVNFEVVGAPRETRPTWERAFARAPEHMIEAWMSALQQGEGEEHALVRTLERTRRPVLVDSIEEADHLTDEEKQVLLAGGLRSGLAVPMIWHDRLVGILSVASREKAAFTSWDAHFLTAVASQVTAIVYMTTLVEELQAASNDLKQAHAETVLMLAAAAEAHDDTTGRHLRRVRAVTEALSLQLGYSEEQAEELGMASVLHDIGKIRVSDRVLTRPGKLADDEWVLMKQHTLWGAEFLSGRRGFDLAKVIARSHHERWDGAGYPDGLAGDEIPEAALITAVADSFDAITSDRPYRAGRPAGEAVQEIASCSGRQFSPRVVQALIRVHKRGALPLVEDGAAERVAAA